MAIIRRAGFGSVFEVENETVGIGTTGTATNTVQVLGETKAPLALVSGISSLTTYQGFVDNTAEFGNSNVDINSQSGTLGNIEICHGDFNVSSASTLTSSVNQLTLTNSFSVPTGNIDSRIHCHTPGSMRFNEDLGTLEFYTGDMWKTVNSFKDTGNRGRVVIGGGYGVNPSNTNSGTTDFLNITTLGDSRSFGELVLSAKYSQSGCSDGIRGLFQGGQSVTDIEYITIASEGDSIDFGNLTSNGNHCASLASSTRGLRAGGYTVAGINTIDYVQIQTLGDSLDFGDLLEISYGAAGMASPTRGIIAGGRGADTPVGQTTINLVTIASTGNAVNFGNISARQAYVAGFSNSIRGFVVGGTNEPASRIQYLTIASDGNVEIFGDLSSKRRAIASGSSNNHVRGLICAGRGTDTENIVEFITIATTGNSQDFGDCVNRAYGGAVSDSHGGLGGF